jgi:hypothetical protein
VPHRRVPTSGSASRESPLPSEGDPWGGLPIEETSTRELLRALRVSGADSILSRWPEDRVREVCLAAIGQLLGPKPPRSVSGWIICALSRGWTVRLTASELLMGLDELGEMVDQADRAGGDL